jgi:hypothetical protein
LPSDERSDRTRTGDLRRDRQVCADTRDYAGIWGLVPIRRAEADSWGMSTQTLTRDGTVLLTPADAARVANVCPELAVQKGTQFTSRPCLPGVASGALLTFRRKERYEL